MSSKVELSELDFKLVLDDKDFNQKLKDAQKQAQVLSDTMVKLLDMEAKLSKSKKGGNSAAELLKQQRLQAQINNELEKTRILQQKLTNEKEKYNKLAAQTATAERKAIDSFNKSAASAKKSTNALSSQEGILGRLTGLMAAYLSVDTATRFIKSLMTITGEFEMQRRTLGAIIGDTAAAEGIFAQLKDLAVKSPMTFKELATYTKQLSAYSLPTDELFKTTKMLADVSSGLGVSMDRLVLAYGQIRSAAFLRGQEVRQLTEAGIPILQELAKQFQQVEGRMVSAGEVFERISKRQVTFEMVERVFKDMTEEGGKFYRMQEIQTETLWGKMQKLRDTWQIMLSEMGEKRSGALKGTLDIVIGMISHFETFSKVILDLVIALGAYKATMLTVNTVMSVIDFGKSVKKCEMLARRINAMGGDVTTLGVIWKKMGGKMASAIGLGVAAAATLTTVIIQAVRAARELDNALQNIAAEKMSGMRSEIDSLERLKNALEKTNEGTQARHEIVSKLNRQYGEYLPNILSEKKAVDELASSYDTVVQSIQNKYMAEAREKGRREIEKKYGKNLTEDTNTLMAEIKATGLGEEAAAVILANFDDRIKKGGKDSVKRAVDIFQDMLYDFDKKSWTNVAWDRWDVINRAARSYAKAVAKIAKKESEFNAMLSQKVNITRANTKIELDYVNAIEQEFARVKESKDVGTEEYAEAVDKAAKTRLQKLIWLYKGLDPNTGKPLEEGVAKQVTRMDMAKAFQAKLDAMNKMLDGWKGKVEAKLKELNKAGFVTFGYGVDDYTQSSEYVDKLVKDYKQIKEDKEKIKSFDKSGLEALIRQEKVVTTIAQLLGINLDAMTKKGKKTASNRDAIQALEAERDTLKDIYTWYLKFMELGIGDAATRNILAGEFVDSAAIIKAGTLKKRLAEIADELERLGEKKSAQALRDDLGITNLDSVYDSVKRAQDALQSYKDFLSTFDDTELDGEGSSFDVSKILRNYNKAVKKVEAEKEKAYKAFNDAVASGATDVDFDDWVSKIREKYEVDSTNALKSAIESIRKVGKGWIKEWKRLNSFDISNIGDMSIQELKALKNALASTFTADDIPDDLRKELSKQEGAIEAFVAGVNEEIDNLGASTGRKIQSKTVDKIKQSLNYFNDLADLIRGVGESGNGGIGEGLSEVVEFAGKFADILLDCDTLVNAISDSFKSVSDGAKEAGEEVSNIAKSTDWITMIIKLVLLIGSEIIKAAQDDYALLQAINEGAQKYRDTLYRIRQENATGIFGTDSLEEIVAVFTNAADAAQVFYEKIEKAKTSSSTNLVGNLFSSSALTGLEQMVYAIRKVNEELSETERLNVVSITGSPDFLLEKLVAFDTDTMNWLKAHEEDLKKIMKGYGDSTYTELMDAWEAYVEWRDKVKESLAGVFDDLAGSLADNMLKAFRDVGDATKGIADTFDDIKESIVTTVLKSTLLQNVLNGFQDRAFEIYQNYASGAIDKNGLLQQLNVLLGDMELETERYGSYVNSFLQMAQNAGLLGSEGTDDFSNDIKGITEDTAQLLASYINAIRADVALQRGYLEKMLASFPTAPTLTEYLTKIEANTYNNAVAAQTILARLDSVMTTEGGQTAFRALMS